MEEMFMLIPLIYCAVKCMEHLSEEPGTKKTMDTDCSP